MKIKFLDEIIENQVIKQISKLLQWDSNPHILSSETNTQLDETKQS